MTKPRSSQALSPQQRHQIGKLAEDIPLLSGEEFIVRFQLASVRPLSTADRRRRLRAQLLGAASSYLRNMELRRTKKQERIAEAKLLKNLTRALEPMLQNEALRGRLYVAAERIAGMPAGGLEEEGCLWAKGEEEGRPFLTNVDPSADGCKEVFAKMYRERDQRHPGPWVRDDVQRLISAARYVLERPPYRYNKTIPARDEFIRSVANIWCWATGEQPKKPGKANRGDLGPFARAVVDLFRIVEPQATWLTESGYVDRVRAALLRERSGIFL